MGHGKKDFDKNYYKRFFDKYTKKEFDTYCNWAEGWINFLCKYLSLKKGNDRSVLEIGSSLGYFSYVFKKRGFRVICSDVSKYIVNRAKSFQKSVDFKVIDVEKKINLKNKPDFVVGFEVLEHLKNPREAISNIYRILKKSGVLVFSTPHPTKRSLSDPTHINVHDKTWWMNAGKKAGFKKRKVIYATFVPFLYRFSKIFSIGFPVKTDLPFVNSTVFFIFEK